MTTPDPHFLTTADAVRIAYQDHRPGEQRRPTVLLLHGLAGHRGEWDGLLPLLLADGHRVVTYDARGHGESTRRPQDMSRAACVRDVVALIGDIGEISDIGELGPAAAPLILIGQSLGGHTAFLTAAARPDLVGALVLVEAGPAGGDPNLPSQIGSWLDGWPVPFESAAAAREFFGHEAWARGLEQREGGWYPRVDRDRMVAAVEELSSRAYWEEWSRVRCPTLVVRGGAGTMSPSEPAEMLARRPEPKGATVSVVVIPDASHDVHLDRPAQLHAAVAEFLSRAEWGVSRTPGVVPATPPVRECASSWRRADDDIVEPS